ncbi:RNase H domain-containing protein [Trichonephila clavipes]|nr:RNase H domain-containing protein [Trichonephila clavipes]
MPSPVQSNCDANDTIANGQYGAVWSMGHTQQVCVRIVLLPSNIWQQFFGRSAFLRQQETDLPPAELWCACNEQADSAAKSATTHLPLAVPLSDMKRVIMHNIFKIWQESWSQQLDNKLHSVKPIIGAWPVMPMRRTDVKLTRLRIGHTRLTHRHLLFGEHAPECPSCNVSYTVHHILIDCPVFNHHRITFFHTSILTLSDLVGEIPHQNLFAFIKTIGFLYLI